MTSTLASMDLREQLAALSLGNAPHEDTVGATAVEIPFYHCVAFSQSYYALSEHIVIRKDIIFSGSPGSQRSMHRDLPEQVGVAL